MGLLLQLRDEDACSDLAAMLRRDLHRAPFAAPVYHDHRQLVVDRWLAILAAYNFARTAVCVVDAGTAVTIDAVAADGSHRGGYIVPGPGLMRYSLLRDTSGIRSAADRLPTAPPSPAAWGRDTESCIRRGSLRAVACLVEDCMKALLRDEGRGSLVLTGGDADALGGELSLAVEYRHLLVLEGLALRYGGGCGSDFRPTTFARAMVSGRTDSLRDSAASA